MIRIHNDHPLWWPAKVSAHPDPYEFIQIQLITTHPPSMKLPLAFKGHMHVQSLIDDYNRISDEFADRVNLKFVLPFFVFIDQLRLKMSKYIWIHLSLHPLQIKSPFPLHQLIFRDFLENIDEPSIIHENDFEINESNSNLDGFNRIWNAHPFILSAHDASVHFARHWKK